MTWQERAEKAIGDVSLIGRDMGSASHRVSNYVVESFHHIESLEKRIAFLEKALAQAMETNLQLQVIEAPCILDGVSRNHIGQECIVFGGFYPGEVLGLAAEYPELAQYLRDHIVDAQEMVGEDQK